MAQKTALQVYGLPGMIKSFLAKAASLALQIEDPSTESGTVVLSSASGTVVLSTASGSVIRLVDDDD